MRSHMMNLHVPPKLNESAPTIQLSFEAESSPSPSSGEEEEEEDNKSLCYRLRENPKRSFRIAHPEFSFAAAADTGSVIVQEDRESETESSKNITRRRSKRAWKLGNLNKKMKLSQRNESASSASDTTTEEDVAFCLMLLSRDNKWNNHNNSIEEQEQLQQEDEEHEEEDEDDEGDEDEESDEYEEMMKNKAKTNRVRGGRYKCETCNKVFRSYQALGGHRASHKKIKVDHHHHHHHQPELEHDDENVNNNINNGVVASSSVVVPTVVDNSNTNKKIHECPVCFRVFASGQALGGHKRTHVITTTSTSTTRATGARVEAEVATSKVVSSTKFGRESLIDLNLPAPVDDDDVSQFEDSAVSDAEFVKPVKVFPR